MTTNQFNYAQLAQTAIRDAQTYEINKGQLRELERHQRTTEAIDQSKVDESRRHNLMSETLQRQANEITDWYNQKQAYINMTNARTSGRQADTQALKVKYDYEVNQQNARTNMRNAATNEYGTDAHAKAETANAETNRLNWWTNTVLGAFDTAGGVVKNIMPGIRMIGL